jgi:hypothetical protein
MPDIATSSRPHSAPGGRPLALISLAFILAAPTTASAQDHEDFGIWAGTTITGKLPRALNDSSGSWRLWLDVQIRFGDDASTFAQGIIRPGVGYALSKSWTVWLGYAWVNTEPPYATVTTTEQRIWEQASWAGTAGSARISSRTRLEERFVSTGSETGWRLRELFKGTQPLGAAKIWAVVAYDEFFYNLNSTNYGATAGPDRNRFFIGPGYAASASVFIELGYLNQYTYRNNAPDKLDNVLALQVLWNF